MIIKRSILTIFFTIQNAVSTRGYLMNPLPFGTNTINGIYNQFNNVANGDTMKKYNSKNIDPTANKRAIFLPALTGNSGTSGLYDNFLNLMTKKSFDVYIPGSEYQSILDDINNTECDITLISHSSSALIAINMANAIDSVKSLVLLDPLDVNIMDNNLISNSKTRSVDYDVMDINEVTRPLNQDKKKKGNQRAITIDNLDRLLIINTKRSNDWSMLPFIFPIGSFALKQECIVLDKNVTQEIVIADDFGHFDILDDRWSNMIHNTLSKGTPDRDPIQLELFRAWITNKINEVVTESTTTAITTVDNK